MNDLQATARARTYAAQSPEPPGSRRRWPFVAAALAVVGLATLGYSFARHNSSPVTEEDVTAKLWTACSIANDEIMNGDTVAAVESGEMKPSSALSQCGVFIDRVDGGWTFSLIPHEYDAGISFTQGLITSWFGDLTGCYTDIDRDVMDHTRALDGRVESANGRTSWTYHPDDGLNITCEA